MAFFLTCPIGLVMLLFFLSPVVVAQGPIPPTADPFYIPPEGYERESPGTILRHRPMPYPLADAPSNFEVGYQLLYRTTDALGNAQATVTTLLVPQNADPSKYLSYQTFEDAAFTNCAPSYGLQKGAINGSTLEIVFISIALQHGWYVSVPDCKCNSPQYPIH